MTSLSALAEQTAIATEYKAIVAGITANTGGIQGSVLQRLAQLEALLETIADSETLSTEDKTAYTTDVKAIVTDLKNRVTAVGAAVTAEADRILAL